MRAYDGNVQRIRGEAADFAYQAGKWGQICTRRRRCSHLPLAREKRSTNGSVATHPFLNERHFVIDRCGRVLSKWWLIFLFIKKCALMITFHSAPSCSTTGLSVFSPGKCILSIAILPLTPSLDCMALLEFHGRAGRHDGAGV